MKSRRGAPKRIDTQGFACPNPKCPYLGLTDAHIHALVGDGQHGRVERIQTFRCQACRTTFSARRDTPLYRLKTPSHQVAVVLSALAEGLDASAAERVFGIRQATITTWLSRAARARAYPARALLLPSAPPAPAVGRTAHQAAEFEASALAVVSH
jgi:transposase-like protein